MAWRGKREIAVRTALGAGRARLVRFVMMESYCSAVFGAALRPGAGVRRSARDSGLAIRGIPRLADAGLNPWVLGFAALIAVVTGCCPVSLLHCRRRPATSPPRFATATGRPEAAAKGAYAAVLVTGEVALSFLLLVGAGLLIRSFTQLMNVNPGFQTENRLLFSVSMPNSYGRNGVGKQFWIVSSNACSAVPGVVAAGAVSHRPVEGGNPGMAIDSSPGEQGAEQRSDSLGRLALRFARLLPGGGAAADPRQDVR